MQSVLAKNNQSLRRLASYHLCGFATAQSSRKSTPNSVNNCSEVSDVFIRQVPTSEHLNGTQGNFKSRVNLSVTGNVKKTVSHLM